MKSLNLLWAFSLLVFITSCQKEGGSRGSAESNSTPLGIADFDSSFAGGGSSGGGDGNGGESGLITAGEWSDLENWDFWTDLLTSHEEFETLPDSWSFYTNNRISVHIINGGGDFIDAQVDLISNTGEKVWQSRTDNFGNAELYLNTFDYRDVVDLNQFTLFVNGIPASSNLKFYENGVNEVAVQQANQISNRVELAFLVDATGSMSDEIEFLKKDLEDVIQKVQTKNPQNEILTASVFYRDQNDDYVTKVSDFTSISNTIGFIRDQSADGGGDFPEAVHSALTDCVENLSWSRNAKTRIAFLLLDAPPHQEQVVIDDLQESIKIAAKDGIKIIPITASGINKNTEYLMRAFSILTNSPYVFITDDSGIGNPHLEASVGDYDVEFLNDLMVRLITKYSE